MKNLLYVLCAIMIFTFSTTSCNKMSLDEVEVDLEESRRSKKKKKKKKVFVCHYSKETDSWKTIRISIKALKAHLRHGDFIGKCDEAPEPACTDIYVQDFETDALGWLVEPNWGGTATKVASGINGIASSAGGNHAVFTGSNGTAPRSFFEGASNVWAGNWTAEIDVYLDPNWPASTGFAYSVSVNTTSGSNFRDFVFHINNDADENGLRVGVSGVTMFGPKEDITSGNNYLIPTAAWYKLQHVFYDNGGMLSVDLNLLDSSGTIVFSETIDTGAMIDSPVGGNNYGWFTFINVAGGIAVDEQKRLDCSDSEELL